MRSVSSDVEKSKLPRRRLSSCPEVDKIRDKISTIYWFTVLTQTRVSVPQREIQNTNRVKLQWPKAPYCKFTSDVLLYLTHLLKRYRTGAHKKWTRGSGSVISMINTLPFSEKDFSSRIWDDGVAEPDVLRPRSIIFEPNVVVHDDVGEDRLNFACSEEPARATQRPWYTQHRCTPAS